MKSPFAIFRKHQRTLTVVLTGLAMFAFIIMGSMDPSSRMAPLVVCAAIGAGLFWLFGLQSGTQNSKAVIGLLVGLTVGLIIPRLSGPAAAVETNAGKISREELQDLVRRQQIANQFLNAAYSTAVPAPALSTEIMQLPEQFRNQFLNMQMQGWENQRRTYQFTFGYPNQPQRDAVMSYLYRKEGDRLGIVIGDEAVNDYIRRATNDRLTPREFNRIVREMRIGSAVLYEILRDELKARNAYQLLMPRTVATPEQSWDYYRKFNVRQQLDAAPVPVDAFMSQVPQPSDTELLAFFEQYRDRFPTFDGEPGFRQPQRVQVAYLEADYETIESHVPPVTDEQIETFYNENKDLYKTQPASTPSSDGMPPAPTGGAEPAAGETPPGPDLSAPAQQPAGDEQGDAPADGTKADPDAASPAGEKPPADNPPADNPPAAAPSTGDAPAATPQPSDNAPPGETPPSASDAQPSQSPPAAGEPGSDDSPAAPADNADQAATAAPVNGRLQPRFGLASFSDEAPAASQPPPADEPAAEKPAAAAPPAQDSPAPANAETPAAESPAPSPQPGPSTDAPPAGQNPNAPQENAPQQDQPQQNPPQDSTPQENAQPAADESAPSGPATVPPPALPESADTPPAPEFRPLDNDLKSEIRDQLLRQRTIEAVREAISDANALMHTLGASINLPPSDPDYLSPQAAADRLKQFAEQNHLTYVETPLLSASELQQSEDYPIGNAVEPSDNPFERNDSMPVAFMLFSSENSPTYQPRVAEDVFGGSRYAYWATRYAEEHVPTFDEPGVKEQVVEAWKREKARPLAEKRAKELLELLQKSESETGSLSEALAEQTVTGEKDAAALLVRTTPEFSWLSQNRPTNAPLDPFSQQPVQVSLTEVPGLEAAGNEFMKVVFNELENGEAGVAPNEDRTVYYLVKIRNRNPSGSSGLEALRQQFLQEQFMFSGAYAAVAREDRRVAVMNWMESIENKYDVRWNSEIFDR